MAFQRKPVIVRMFSREWRSGYASASLTDAAEELLLLDLAGKVQRIPWEGVKWLCFVRELPGERGDGADPERLLRKRFLSRPRTPGVWLRLRLLDGEELEGLAANDRSLLDGPGVLLTPPDTRSNTQRIYLPRTSIQALEALGVIAASGSRGHRKAPSDQPGLFPEKNEPV